MSMEVNGAAILSAMAKQPAAFAMAEPQINALVLQTLLAKLKDKAADLPVFRSICKAIGSHDFSVLLDSLPPKDVVSLAKKLDPKNPELKTAAETALRERIDHLAQGLIEPYTAPPPAPKPTKVPKAAAAPKAPKAGKVLKSKALKAR